MYSYEFKTKALKQLKKLDKTVQKKIVCKLDQISKEEILFSNRRLTKFKIGSYRLRIGDYRVIYDIDGKMITVLLLGHRKDIYK
ncbi:MAG: type II toxin-antitoxin system RelE/ParE family toxin [Patescibacteria group bacterium]